MSIVISGAGSNAALPLDQSYEAQIMASTAFVDWFDTDHIGQDATSHLVNLMTSKQPISPRTLFQNTDAKRPAVTANVAGGYQGVTFAGAQVLQLSTNFVTSGAFTWIVIFNIAALANGSIFGNQTTQTQRTALLSTASACNFGHGSASLTTPMQAGTNFAVVGSDGTTASLALNGGAAVAGATDSNVSSGAMVVGAQQAALGNPWSGNLLDIIVLSGSPASNSALIEAAVKPYARAAYGMTIA